VGAEKEQISLRLYVAESTICEGTEKIPVEFEVWNFGRTPLEVDTRAVGNRFDVMALYNVESNTSRFAMTELVGDQITPPAGNYVVVLPGVAHIVRGSVALDRSFFSTSGFYEIRTSLAHKRAGTLRAPAKPQPEWLYVESNRVILNVEPCGQRPPQRAR
jgi:hypothetical protein